MVFLQEGVEAAVGEVGTESAKCPDDFIVRPVLRWLGEYSIAIVRIYNEDILVSMDGTDSKSAN